MHLSEILKLRHVPAAGISIGLTGRCPLHCAHCSTSSTMDSEQQPAEIIERFVRTFRALDRPDILSLSGGEALLRPALVIALAEHARSVNARTTLLSGLFFARSDRIPPAIQRAIDAVDHFSVSLDVHHEREVPRAKVFAVLDAQLDKGKDVSMHLVGTGPDDPYLNGLVADVRERFGDHVPMLVNVISHFGRAREWLPETGTARNVSRAANPCTMAAWPVVGFDGSIAACGNDHVFDRFPPHLILGHAARDDWPDIRRKTLESHILRAIRLFGPEFIAGGDAGAPASGGTYCGTCMNLPERWTLNGNLDTVMKRSSTRVLEAQVKALADDAAPESFLRRHGIARFAPLAMLGAPS